MGTKVKHMNERDYKQIKKLVDAELRVKQIAEFTGRSVNTINRVRITESFEDYKKFILNMNAKYRQARPVQQQATVSLPVAAPKSAVISDDDLTRYIGNISESLDNIDRRLEFLEENCAIPSKKTKQWFK